MIQRNWQLVSYSSGVVTGCLHTTPVESGAKQSSDRAFLGHPVGLGYIAFAEAWERFSYYGMQTLLVLYMVKQLLLPGHIENIAGFSGFRGIVESFRGPLSTVAL